MKKFFTFIAVAVMAFAANAATFTVADGNATDPHFPFYGLYYDTEGTTSQMIYPDYMLTDLVGQEITELKFYSRDAIYLNANGNIQFAMMVVENNEFANSELLEVPGECVCGNAVPVYGETEFVVTLDEPFLYEGGNLLIQSVVTSGGNYSTTYFYGQETGLYGACYQYAGWSGTVYTYRLAFLPKVTFTCEEGAVTPPTPTEQTAAPVFNGYTEDGIHAYFVEIIPTEPSVIYYRVQYPDGTWTEWAEYEEILSFTGDGKYRVEAYAIAPGKAKSFEIAYEFVVAPLSGIDEMMSGKTVAGVRYYNMAGQEMTEANGMTIVVTTYTDGTTSAVKVVK